MDHWEAESFACVQRAWYSLFPGVPELEDLAEWENAILQSLCASDAFVHENCTPALFEHPNNDSQTPVVVNFQKLSINRLNSFDISVMIKEIVGDNLDGACASSHLQMYVCPYVWFHALTYST